jgi:hypothetical protein
MFAKIFVGSLCALSVAVGFLIGGVHAEPSRCSIEAPSDARLPTR